MSKKNIKKVDIYDIFKKKPIEQFYDNFKLLAVELVNYVKSFYDKNVKYKVKYMLDYINKMVQTLIKTNYDPIINVILLKIKKSLLKNKETIDSVGYSDDMYKTIKRINSYGKNQKKQQIIQNIINETDTVVNEMNTVANNIVNNNFSETSNFNKKNVNISETSTDISETPTDIESKLNQLDSFK